MGRKLFVLSMAAGGGTMLAGIGVIVSQPRSFLPPGFGCFDCSFGAGISPIDVAGTALYFTMALIPVALAFSVWRWFIRLREHGPVAVTDDQSVTRLRNHTSLRVLSSATVILALIAGGLIVQAGYMSELNPTSL